MTTHTTIGKAPSYARISSFLEEQLPGASPATRKLREAILDFCFDFTARTVFLNGPIGAGKSTVARMIGFCRRLAPLKDEEVVQLISHARFSAPGLIDEKLMHWYVELALTGLVETLAETQLFGIGKSVATNVGERAGVFELAQLGHRVGDSTAATHVTGGVVFLDEIAELTPALQAKLLPVLSGGVFHRVGVESRDLTFKGVTIAASWKNLADTVRPDLISRISDRIILVPGLTERGGDVIGFIKAIQSDLIRRYRAQVDDLLREPAVDRFWIERARAISILSPTVVERLASVPWELYGNLRGLTLSLRRLLFTGEGLETVLSELQSIETDGPDKSLVARLLRRSPDGTGLANHVRELERQDRRRLREILTGDSTTRDNVLRHLGLNPKKAAHQFQQLDRSRKRK
jgi:DNA-binding NtrC family response regulator